MEQEGTRESEDPGEDYRGWPPRDRLELLAFDAGVAGVDSRAAGGALGGDRPAS
jgi:hypothetical protein